jgi:hypothetical protein
MATPCHTPMFTSSGFYYLPVHLPEQAAGRTLLGFISVLNFDEESKVSLWLVWI